MAHSVRPEHSAFEDYTRRLQGDDKQRARYALGALLSATLEGSGWRIDISGELIHRSQRYDMDGTIRDHWGLPRGYWRALPVDTALPPNIAATYPLDNLLIANTQTAALIQSGEEVARVDDLNDTKALAALLTRFYNCQHEAFAAFDRIADGIGDAVTTAGKAVNAAVKAAHTENPKFIGMYEVLLELCRGALNPTIRQDAVDEMLVQHVLALPLLEAALKLENFVKRNLVASEIEKVTVALVGVNFNRAETLKPLQPLYDAARSAAAHLDVFHDIETFVTTVYERFFRGFSVEMVDSRDETHTPQPVVNFMNALVLEVLENEFGITPGSDKFVMLDPAAGTGNFIADMLRRTHENTLDGLYTQRLYANEVMLLPYYLASLQIEHVYHTRRSSYVPFNGLSFVDTLTLTGSGDSGIPADENAERIEQQRDANITVIISDPPYDLRQLSANDTTRSRTYPSIDQKVRATYVNGDITGAAKSAPQDAYIKFLRWATDRLGDRDGVVCMLTDNRFTDQDAFDGVRKRLLQDFTRIYHVDLRGSSAQMIRGVEREIGITLAIRSGKHKERRLYYYHVPEEWHRVDILQWLGEMAPNPGVASVQEPLLKGIKWHPLLPDERYTWLARRSVASSRDTRIASGMDVIRIFKEWSGGVQATRDAIAYNFDRTTLAAYLNQYHGIVFDPKKIRQVEYRPFTRKYGYYDGSLVPQKGIFARVFPDEAAEKENRVIWVRIAPEAPVFALVVNRIAVNLPEQGTKCFPLYIYDEDGSNRRDNIADWVLTRFRDQYGDDGISKWQIFHYIYAMLHHPTYRMRCANITRHDLPRVPFVPDAKGFRSFAEAGERLAELHLDYEGARKFSLHWAHDGLTTVSFRVEKMQLNPDKRTVRVNDAFTLEGIPVEAFGYRIGNLSALEWLIEQYQITKDIETGLDSNPNHFKDERYVISLVERVVYISVETVRIMRELAATQLRSIDTILKDMGGG